MIYFSLAPMLYAARYEHAIVLLDVKQDTYLSLINDAAAYLTLILDNGFIKAENDQFGLAIPSPEHSSRDITQWITEFTGKGFITQTTHQAERRIGSIPLQPGGLREYQWDTKTQWKPFSKAGWWDIMRSYLRLMSAYRAMKKNKMAGLFGLLKKNASAHPLTLPRQADIDKLVAAVDAATILYPKKTYCLVWATT